MQGASRSSLATARARLGEVVATTEAAELSEQLFAVVGLLGGELQLRRTLADPAVPGPARRHLLEQLLAGKVSAAAVELLSDVVALRWSGSADLLDAIRSLAAQASFEQAQAAGTLDSVDDELFRFARLLEREGHLHSALTDPSLPAERKRDLLAALLEGKVDPVTFRLVNAVVLNGGHRRSIDRALDELGQLSAELRERSIGRVTVAVPLSDEQVERLRQALSRLYGRDIDVRVEVDPRVVGGVVVRVGDEVVDGSVARRLARLQQELGGSALAS